MGFNARTEDVEEKIKQKDEEKRQKMNNDTRKLRVEDGLNVFWIMPGMGETFRSVVDLLIHYRPFHRCLREDPVPKPNSDSDDKWETDGGFSNCIRCQTAWNHYDDAGTPKGGPYKDKFQDDMETHRAFFQAIDFSPFFEATDIGLAEVNNDVVDRWLDTFLEVVFEEREDAPEDMPDDMAEAAELSPGIVGINKKQGRKIRKRRRIKMDELEGKDPMMNPGEMLFQIIREKDGSDTFQGRNGQEVAKRTYEHRFTSPGKIKGWSLPDDFMQKASEVGQDILNQEPEDDTLEARALAFEVLSEDELETYLDEQGHSYTPNDGDDSGGNSGGGGGAKGPDDFGDDGEDFGGDGFNSADYDDDDVDSALGVEEEAEAEKLKDQE